MWWKFQGDIVGDIREREREGEKGKRGVQFALLYIAVSDVEVPTGVMVIIVVCCLLRLMPLLALIERPSFQRHQSPVCCSIFFPLPPFGSLALFAESPLTERGKHIKRTTALTIWCPLEHTTHQTQWSYVSQ